ncbi:MAG: HemK/PrmC family methyltransferase [bacterium]
MNLKNLLKSNNFTIFETIKAGAGYLKKNNVDIHDCFKESLLLMSYVLNIPIEKIIINYESKINKNKLKVFNGYIERRAKKEPFAYIIKNKEFYSIDFFVNKNVLIPRPDTEILVDESLKEINRLNARINNDNNDNYNNYNNGINKDIDNNINNNNKKADNSNYKNNNGNYSSINNNNSIDKNITVIDLGTGSGAVAVSIAKNYQYSNIEIYAADNSFRVLNVAKNNIILNSVENKIKLTYFNILNPNIYWYNKSKKKYDARFYEFDIIISNPPYIISDDIDLLSDEVKNYEPYKALDGGADGLKFYRKIFELFSSAIENSADNNPINKEFCLILEIDYRYKEEIKKIYELTFYNKDNRYNKYDNNDRKKYEHKINNKIKNNKYNKKDPINITINFIKDMSGKERVVKINYGKNNN